MSLTTIGHLLLATATLPLIFAEPFQTCDKRKEEVGSDDDCPRHFRRCNDSCLDNTTNHTEPCHTGPWGKCLSAHFPFYCNVTDTCIGKDELCGDHCFHGNPDSFWYDHSECDKTGEYGRIENLWRLEDEVYDEMFSRSVNCELSYKSHLYVLENEINHIDSCERLKWVGMPGSAGRWLQRYNCEGKCITYKELCKGGCDHPNHLMKWGKPVDVRKCGTKCLEDREMYGRHNCGDECVSSNVPCNGTCSDVTFLGAKWPLWVCGNECRPIPHTKWMLGPRRGRDMWKVCPDGSCRVNSVNCEGPLPGTCPPGHQLCRLDIGYRCRLSSEVYYCNETEIGAYVAKQIGAFAAIFSSQNITEKCKEYTQTCNGECITGYVNCYDERRRTNTCKDARKYIKCGDKCKQSKSYSMCNGKCIYIRNMCDGVCAEGYEKCGESCIDSIRDDNRVDCNGICQSSSLLCDGKCLKPGWSKAMVKDNSLDIYEFACKANSKLDDEYDGYHKCNGIFSDNEIPCNGTCTVPGRKLCRGVCVTGYYSWNCDGECISRMEHCNGKCYRTGYVPCGRKCVDKKNLDSGKAQPCGDRCLTSRFSRVEYVCNGECSTGKIACGEKCYTWERAAIKSRHSECEMDECRNGTVLCGKSCTTEEQMKNMYECGNKCFSKRYACEGKCPEDRPIKCMGPGQQGEICLTKWAVGNGNKDCADGSDELCDINGYDYKIILRKMLPNETSLGYTSRYDFCVMGNGSAKCVQRAIDGEKPGWRSDIKAEDGEPCDDDCFAGVKCGNKCLAKFNKHDKWYPTCNGNCHHINSSKTMVTCDGYCWEEEELIQDFNLPTENPYVNQMQHSKLSSIKDFKPRNANAVNCDGECRMFATKEQRIKARRRTCNGTCLENGIACASGDECYSGEEWCSGVEECEDGSDELNCHLCPSIKRCEFPPDVNHISSNGPRFPDFVCPDEPCGENCNSDTTYACGNACIPNDKICSLTNECRSNSFFKCDKCLELELVCDGKQDCQDGSDEDNCTGSKGSWFCNDQMQSRTIPCTV